MNTTIYILACICIWSIFSFAYFRCELFGLFSKKKTAENSVPPEGSRIETIGVSSTKMNLQEDFTPPVYHPVDPSDEYEVEYNETATDILDSTSRVAPCMLSEEFPDIESFLDDINNDLNKQQQERHLQNKELKQLEFAFDTLAAPQEAILQDQEAGDILKDLGKTDMFLQAFEQNYLRVNEVLASVSCRATNADNYLDVESLPQEEIEIL